MDSSPPHRYDWPAHQLDHDLFIHPSNNYETHSASSNVPDSHSTSLGDALSPPYLSTTGNAHATARLSKPYRGVGGDGGGTTQPGTQETWMDFLRDSGSSSNNTSALDLQAAAVDGWTGFPHPPSSTADNDHPHPFAAFPPRSIPEPSHQGPLTGFANVQYPAGSSLSSANILRPSSQSGAAPPVSRHPGQRFDRARAQATYAAKRAALQESLRKRRLTDSAPSGREVRVAGQAEPAVSRPRMSQANPIDLTSSPSTPRRDSHGRRVSGTNLALHRRRSSLNAGSGGSMRVDEPGGHPLAQQPGDADLSLQSPVIAADRPPSDVVLPEWQPDNQVTKCPVCNNHFGFFYRKHHCRKCGRVVCANCSPHRITMPHQYIVQPPAVIDLTTEDGDVSPQQPSRYGNPALGGGSQVRVCNPCVPDPNLNPPPQQPEQPPPFYGHPAYQPYHYAHHQWASTPTGQDSNQARGINQPYHSVPSGPEGRHSDFPPFQASDRRVSADGPTAPDSLGRERTNTNEWSPASALFPPYSNNAQLRPSILDAPLPPPPASRPPQAMFSSSFGVNQLAAPRTSSRVHRPHHSTGDAGFHSPHTAYGRPHSGGPDFLDQRAQGPAGLALPLPIPPRGQRIAPLPPTNFGQQAGPPPPPPPQRRQIAEEDECPVCGNELPPKGSNGEETERERHVEECIASHFTPRGPSSRTTSNAADRAADADRVDPTLPQNFPAGSSSAPSHIPSNNPLSRPRAESSVAGSADATASQPRQRRATGNRMLVYTATEKDCVGEEGEAAECIICFEEFEPGTELGRLECLCKFHRSCIRRWWEAKGMGSCPTHQLHD